LLVLAGSPGATGADPALFQLLQPDAKFVAGVDFDRVRNAPFGQFLLQRAEAERKQIDSVTETLGLDPRRDVRQVLISSSDAGTGQPLVLVSVNYDETKLSNGLLGARGLRPIESYQGVRIVGSLHGKHDSSMAFLPGMIALGGGDQVKALIDRRGSAGRTPSVAEGRVQTISSRYDAWIFANGSPSALVGAARNKNLQGAMNSDLFRGIESMAGGVKFGANVEIGGEATARSAGDASALVDVVRFLASMAESSGGAGVGRMLESLQLTADGRVVRFSFTTTTNEFEKLFDTGRRQVRPVVHRIVP
jgi:hypothetical protein